MFYLAGVAGAKLSRVLLKALSWKEKSIKISHDLHTSNSFTLRYTYHWHVQPITCPLNPSLDFLRTQHFGAKACNRRKGYRRIARCFRVYSGLCYPRSLQNTIEALTNSKL